MWRFRGRGPRIVLVASLDDLEAMKRTSTRAEDKLDLEEIEVIWRLRAQGERR